MSKSLLVLNVNLHNYIAGIPQMLTYAQCTEATEYIARMAVSPITSEIGNLIEQQIEAPPYQYLFVRGWLNI